MHLRRAAQPPVERIAPAVVAAHQRPRAAAVAFGERAGAVAADIVQRAQPALRRIGLGFSAHDEQRHPADRRHDVVAGRVQLRGMRDQLPAGREHRFGLTPLPVFVDIAVRRQRQRVRGGLQAAARLLWWAAPSHRHRRLDVRVRVVVDDLEIVVRVVEDRRWPALAGRAAGRAGARAQAVRAPARSGCCRCGSRRRSRRSRRRRGRTAAPPCASAARSWRC